jgi:predicted RNA-binding Zn ribbon-like protein
MIRRRMAQPPWYWLSEPLAMDFANTIHRRGMVEVDHLVTGGDVASWCAHEPPGRVPRVSARAAAPRIEEIRALRDDVHAVLRATVDGTALPRAAVARINAMARSLPLVAQIGDRPGDRRETTATRSGAVDELLARIAADAIETVAAGGPGAVRFCDAPSCGGFFAPERANQRWCDDSCGTRARVARHAAAHRGTA